MVSYVSDPSLNKTCLEGIRDSPAPLAETRVVQETLQDAHGDELAYSPTGIDPSGEDCGTRQ